MWVEEPDIQVPVIRRTRDEFMEYEFGNRGLRNGTIGLEARSIN